MKKIVISLFLLAIMPSFKAMAQKEADSALIDAVALFSDGKYQEAVKALAQLSQKYPDNDAVYYYLGLSCCYAGESGLGENYLREAFNRDSTNYWYQDYLARVCSVNGKPEETISLYEDLQKKNPKKSQISYALVDLYASSGNFDKVLEILDDIEEVHGASEEVALYKYQVLVHLKKEEEAFAVLDKYNSRYSSEKVLTAMGDSYLSQYKDTSALQSYTEALSYVPDFAPAILGRAEIFRMRRSYPSFFAELTQYLSLDNVPAEGKTKYFADVLARMDPGVMNEYRAQIDYAMDLYREKAPLDSNGFRLVGGYYFSTGRVDKAVAVFAQNATQNPESVDARLTYIQVLIAQKEWGKILETCQKACADFPKIPDFYSIMAECCHETGRTKEAFRYYEKALGIDPQYVVALNNYAYYLCCEGKKLKKALEMSRIAIDKEPDNPTYLDTYGWILHLMGRSAEAKQYFKHAMLYGGKDSQEVLGHYADVLDAIGEEDMARLYRSMASKLKKN